MPFARLEGQSPPAGGDTEKPTARTHFQKSYLNETKQATSWRSDRERQPIVSRDGQRASHQAYGILLQRRGGRQAAEEKKLLGKNWLCKADGQQPKHKWISRSPSQKLINWRKITSNYILYSSEFSSIWTFFLKIKWFEYNQLINTIARNKKQIFYK